MAVKQCFFCFQTTLRLTDYPRITMRLSVLGLTLLVMKMLNHQRYFQTGSLEWLRKLRLCFRQIEVCLTYWPLTALWCSSYLTQGSRLTLYMKSPRVWVLQGLPCPQTECCWRCPDLPTTEMSRSSRRSCTVMMSSGRPCGTCSSSLRTACSSTGLVPDCWPSGGIPLPRRTPGSLMLAGKL